MAFDWPSSEPDKRVYWDWQSPYGTALHIACYHGKRRLVKFLLKQGANINIQNSEGDTPLHRAMFAGREDIVQMLLEEGTLDWTILNKEAKSALAMAKNKETAKILQVAQREFGEAMSKKLLEAARAGSLEKLRELFHQRNAASVNMNIIDPKTGNSLLHYLVKLDDQELVITCLQQGANVNLANDKGLLPVGVAKSDGIRSLLTEKQNALNAKDTPASTKSTDIVYSGTLTKWTNYATGWRKRYFTIEKDMIFYYSSAKNVEGGSALGSIRLLGAVIMRRKSDARTFLISGRNSVTWHLKAENAQEADQWISALTKITKTAVTRDLDSSSTLHIFEDHAGNRDDESIDTLLTSLKWQTQSLEKYITSIATTLKSSPGLQTECELFQKSADAVIETMNKLSVLSEQQQSYWKEKYLKEAELRINLEESLRSLAVEQNELEQQAIRMTGGRALSVIGKPLDQMDSTSSVRISPPKRITEAEKKILEPSKSQLEITEKDMEEEGEGEEEEDEFYDALQGPTSSDILPTRKSSTKEIFKHRIELPAPMKDRSEISLWAVIKESVGKDLSKISVPVYFNEPLSFLQKFAEDMEYADLLAKAANAKTSLERLQYVAAFALSPYSSTTRVAKPFNPILGETFEIDSLDDRGYRYFAEQVSHHPPISACHAESPHYIYWAEAHIKNRFLGNTIEVNPCGSFHVVLESTKEHFYWHRTKTLVHNLIIGTVWVDSYGDLVITNHQTGESCHMKLHAKSWWGRNNYAEVTGHILDRNGDQVAELEGKWNDSLRVREASSNEWKTLWKMNPPIPLNQQRYYNFTQFAMELNELTPGLEKKLCPTDSRLRPDQRAMELGNYEVASSEKLRLEEKQRAARRVLAEQGRKWHPRWFRRTVDEETGLEIWKYTDEYWPSRDSNDFRDVPDIF